MRARPSRAPIVVARRARVAIRRRVAARARPV